MKYTYCLLITLIICNCPLSGQTISYSYGVTYINDKSKVKLHPEVLGNGVGGNDDMFYQVEYSHRISKKLNLESSFSNYPISVLYYFNSVDGEGAYGWPKATIIKRYDIGIGYVPFPKSNFIIQPRFNLGLQVSKDQGFGIIGTIPTDILPSEFRQVGSLEAQAFSNTQLVPAIGLKLGYAFWGRLEFFLDIQQVFGFKTVQELRLDYTYKGVAQPTAINYSDGSGRFWALGLGYRIIKPKK